MTDKMLCQKVKNGDRGALYAAIERFTPYVSTAAWRVLAGSPAAREDLEEVVSDTFLALWDHAAEVDPERIRPWLATVAKNRAIDRLRRLTPTVPLSENDPDLAPGPEDEAILRERAEKLWNAVNELPEPDRKLFIRHYYEGEKVRDAARALGMKTATAKTKLHRGRKTLKALLSEGGDK